MYRSKNYNTLSQNSEQQTLLESHKSLLENEEFFNLLKSKSGISSEDYLCVGRVSKKGIAIFNYIINGKYRFVIEIDTDNGEILDSKLDELDENLTGINGHEKKRIEIALDLSRNRVK